jgi:iron complex transport system permease protein
MDWYSLLQVFTFPFPEAKALNALMLGDELAHSLGFSVHQERLLLLSLFRSWPPSVSLGGTIGFISLLIPHIVQFIVGADNRILIPVSALRWSISVPARPDPAGLLCLPWKSRPVS